ncbi:hypothetical protein E8E13_005089 [Curvularia kusanoi]|uniref:DUF159-domain-containing protein n=1 Tax=Curvularia kusanoi TaxID=90978 RepID=A0A9P4TKB1_CURKU|nr:hypothetical protein E8E13_005089 [Curvularia kusanoi]
MPVEEAPPDDEVRQSYNFAPGYHGLVYRAEESDHGGQKGTSNEEVDKPKAEGQHAKYKLQSMQWGLVPFWTKRNPDYGSKMKTINCRDDSLLEDRVAQGFYEWLKKNNGKEKLPHFTKRKDGQLMCFAGLWDRVQFEDSNEPLYTYTIITTDSNQQLKFLHDRMPVILDNGSDAIRTWLDPSRTEWSQDLQSLLKPYAGELDCFPVSKDVGKVGNNSPSFLIPIDSTENKSNIANFFGNQRKLAKKSDQSSIVKVERDLEKTTTQSGHVKLEHDANETRDTTDRLNGTENNAPQPVPDKLLSEVTGTQQGIKREADDDPAGGIEHDTKRNKTASPQKRVSPVKTPAKKQGTRSATTNGSAAKTPVKGDGNARITSFFGNR